MAVENSTALMMDYVEKIIEIVEELETAQLKIKQCHEFLWDNAARKTPYVATDYFEQQIEALKMDKPAFYMEEIKQLTEII